MPCLIALVALLAPRVVIVLVAVFSDYLGAAYSTTVWPVLGFVFLPYTTLAYAWAWHATGGNIGGLPVVVIVLAVLADIGALGGGGAARRRRPRVG